jgi:hypothetical protein
VYCRTLYQVINTTCLRERDQWGDPDVDGRIILRWIFGKLDVGVGTGSSWLRIGTGREELVSAVMNLRVP